jgi:hypothetical protein
VILTYNVNEKMKRFFVGPFLSSIFGAGEAKRLPLQTNFPATWDYNIKMAAWQQWILKRESAGPTPIQRFISEHASFLHKLYPFISHGTCP